MRFYIILIAFGVLLDQISKALVVYTISDVSTLPIIPNVFHLTYIENTGAAFSLFTGMTAVLVVINLLFIGIICYLFYQIPKTRKNFTLNFGFAMIISGAIGNLIDRIRLSYVIDFFDFRLIHFAVFNLADVFITVGAFIVVFVVLKNKGIIKSSDKKFRRKNRRVPAVVRTELEILPSPDTPISIDPSPPGVDLGIVETFRKQDAQPVTFAKPKEPAVHYKRRTPNVKQSGRRTVPAKPKRAPNRYNLATEEYERSLASQRAAQPKREPKPKFVRYEEVVSISRKDPVRPRSVQDRYGSVLDNFEKNIKNTKRDNSVENRYGKRISSYEDAIKRAKEKHYTERSNDER